MQKNRSACKYCAFNHMLFSTSPLASFQFGTERVQHCHSTMTECFLTCVYNDKWERYNPIRNGKKENWRKKDLFGCIIKTVPHWSNDGPKRTQPDGILLTNCVVRLKFNMAFIQIWSHHLCGALSFLSNLNANAFIVDVIRWRFSAAIGKKPNIVEPLSHIKNLKMIWHKERWREHMSTVHNKTFQLGLAAAATA